MRKKKWFQETSSDTFSLRIFLFVLLISNHTVLVQFEINLHLWVFQKAEIALAEMARANSEFLKNSLLQINSKLNEKNHMITYT